MTAVSDTIIHVIASSLQIKPTQVTHTVELLQSGNTVPFVARYRKEATGALDEEQIRTIQERYVYATELEARKATVLDTIEVAGKLTAELRDRITSCLTKIFTSLIAPNAVRKPASPVRKGWNRWPMPSSSMLLTSLISTPSPIRSSVLTRVSRAPRRLWKEPDTSSPSVSPMTRTSGNGCVNAYGNRGSWQRS